MFGMTDPESQTDEVQLPVGRVIKRSKISRHRPRRLGR